MTFNSIVSEKRAPKNEEKLDMLTSIEAGSDRWRGSSRI